MFRAFVLLSLIVAACGGGASSPVPTSSRVPIASSARTAEPSAAASAAPSAAPTEEAPTGAPVGSLDPSESDAGIAVRVTLVNDESGGRDGTYDVYAVDADGSECDGSFEEPDYTVVAWVDDAPIGQIHRFGISVSADDVPDVDGEVTDVDQARVSFDFVSESGIGTQYTGDATSEDSGSATVDITRVGDSLTFDFEGVTSAGAAFSGQFLCEEI